MGRLAKLREHMSERKIDGMLVLQPENRRYLSGFSGSSAALLLTLAEAYLFTDFRYVEQATSQASDFTVIKHAPQMWDTVTEYVAKIPRLGFEPDFVTYEQYQLLYNKFKSTSLVPMGNAIEDLRRVKDEAELTKLQQAADLADEAFHHILTYIMPGMTERQIALELEFFMRREGASGASFDFIVASGPRSSLPHGVASERLVSNGEFITMDFGCIVDGYCSDITRTVILGEPSEQQREIYNLVLKAQLAALAGIKPGVTGMAVDSIARDIITAGGYADNFGHGLGHGVGLAIHEAPRLNPSGDTLLQAGMVVTDEPGIYLPSWGGVRIEDTVVVTSTGCRALTKSPKELIIL